MNLSGWNSANSTRSFVTADEIPDRAVRVDALPSGQRLVVEWHKGSAGPPSAAEVDVLTTALTETRG